MLKKLLSELADGTVTARTLVEGCLERIGDSSGEGARAFLKVNSEYALAAADAVDRQRREGRNLPPLAGIPVSIKDLFDVRGEVTTAGSTVLRNQPAATADALAVARLRSAGCIALGRTNMTEFAYSGLGLNPHYGTPRNPYDRAVGRIPGGSSSGAAVAVTDGMAVASLGTDTGGSCRIPAALCGIVGFKPTAYRVPRNGTYPLSRTLDSIGPLATSVADCALLDALLAGESLESGIDAPVGSLRLWVPSTLVLDGLDEYVARDFERALYVLSQARVQIDEAPLSAFQQLPRLNSRGGIAAFEAYAWHRQMLESHGTDYDPRVATRILKGRDIGVADHETLLRERSAMIGEVRELCADYDALVMPTVPIIAPRMDEFTSDERYLALNAAMLRNPSIANFLDGCSISLPMHRPGAPPTGLMLLGQHGADRRLLAVAAAVEAALGTVPFSA